MTSVAVLKSQLVATEDWRDNLRSQIMQVLKIEEAQQNLVMLPSPQAPIFGVARRPPWPPARSFTTYRQKSAE